MTSTEKARVSGKRREKKRRRLILSGSDEDDDNMVSMKANKNLDEGGDGVKVETKSDLGVEAVTQVEAVEVHQNGIEDDSKKIETAPLTEEKSGIDGSIRVEDVKVESNTGLSLEAVDRMEANDHKDIENATPKKEIRAEYIVMRSKDTKKHRETGTLGDSCKQVVIALPMREKGGIDESTRVEEVKVESNTGLSLEAVDRMDVDDGKKIENATPKKEIHAEYEIVSRSKDVKKHKATDVLGDSRHGSGSMIKTKNGPDCSPRKEATKIGLKKVLKSKVDNRREEVGSTKFYTAKRNNSIDKLSGKEGMELYMKKVLESKHVKVGEEAGGNNKSPGFSVSSRKMKDQVLLEEEKVELKKVPRSAVVKGRGEAESGKKRATESGSERKRQREISGDEIHSKKFRLDSHRQELSSERGEKNTKRRFLKSGDEGYNDRQRGESDEKTMQENLKKNELLSEKKRATELGSERKRQRDTSGDEIHSKKFRPEHVKHRQELSSERSEKNTKRRFLKSGDEGYNNKQRGEFDEKTMQEDLKKNELPSENGRWMERSTARTLRKLKDNGTPGSVRNDDADVSQQNGPRVQGKQVALRVNNKKVREVEGVHVQREEKESKKFTRNHLALSKERKFEKPISTIKKPSKVSAPGAKTAREASSPKINSRKVASSNVTTDPIAKGGTGSESKASVLIQPNTEEDGHKGGKGRGKGGNKQQSTAKQKIREEIKGILLDAGWWIDLRPRRGRAYEDSVYMPPTGGGGFWSITKAYAKYMEYSKNSNASSEKQSKKATGGDRDHEGATPTFATVPADHLNMLTRKVVNKRRSREEIERDELLGVRKGRTIRRDASESGKGRNKRRGLLVRGANPDANADDDDYVPYIWKRTIMSWMIDSGVVQLDGKVKYMNKKQTQALLVGSITRDGIRCSCCSKIISISKFEIHAGSKLHQPYQNIIVDESGDSLLQCQVNAWEKQQESERQSFYKVDTEGDDPNDDSCGICGDGGDLICCDGCPSTFHLNCLDFQMLPPGEWHCTNCSCRYCGLVVDDVPIENDSDTSTLLTCLQCEKKFHVDCIPEAEVISVSSNDSDVSFCGKNCKKVFKKLQKLIGTKNNMEAGLSWRLIRHFGDESSGHPLSLPKKVECNSKIAVAFAVMDECFCPIVDYRSGINLIHNVVYNCGSNINRLSFTGFYAFVLERGDEIIAVASVRIHGTRLAEMPFIGTRNMYRRQGMCRQLLNGIESALYSLNVEKLIIPAISELTETWTNIFGFKHLNLSQRQEVRSTNMLVFPGTGLLQKPILSKGSTEEHSTYGGGEVGESVREEKRIATNETTVHQNQEPDNAVATVALGSNATGDNSGGCAAVIENQHLLGAANESSVSSVNPELYGADKGVSDPKFEPAVVCHNEPMVEDAYQTSSWNVSKIEAPWEVTMFDNHETKDRGVTDTPSLYVVNGTSVRHATEDGHGPQEPTGAKITHNMHSDGDILLPKTCVVCCNSSGINGFTMQDCDGCHAHAPVFPQDCSSVATHLPSFEPTGESGSSSVVCHGSLAANEHVVDANHVRGTHSTTFQAELKPSSDSLSHSDLGVDAKLVDSMEGKDPLSSAESNFYAICEGSRNDICDVKVELGPVKFEANAVDQETEPCTDSVNDRPSGIPRAKESEANGSSVTNNSCNITEPDKGMPCDGCSHRQHMVARDSAPVIVSNTASCEFTGCTLLDSSHLKSESGPDPHARGSVAEFPNSHAAEDFSCGVGPSICMGTASGGSLSKVVAQEVEKNSDDVSAKTDHCRAKGVCDTAHSDDVSVDAIPAHSGTLQGSDGALNL